MNHSNLKLDSHRRLNSYPSNHTRGSSQQLQPASMQVGFTVHNESTLSFADRQPANYYVATNQSLVGPRNNLKSEKHSAQVTERDQTLSSNRSKTKVSSSRLQKSSSNRGSIVKELVKIKDRLSSGREPTQVDDDDSYVGAKSDRKNRFERGVIQSNRSTEERMKISSGVIAMS